MNEPIAEEIDGHDLQRFYADFHRALRMHHIGRLNLFFRLQFLSEDLPLETGGEIASISSISGCGFQSRHLIRRQSTAGGPLPSC